MLKVMGLDQGAANTGLCVIKARCSKYSFKVLHEEAFQHKMVDFRNRVQAANAILEVANTYKPDIIVIEDYIRRSFATNTSSYEHGEVGGMTKKLLYEAGFTLFLIPPTTMRSFVDAPPKSPKEYLEEAAKTRLGYVSTASTIKKRSDITDALWHAHIGALTYFAKQGTLKYKLLDCEKRILYGDDKIIGLKDRNGIEYGTST